MPGSEVLRRTVPRYEFLRRAGSAQDLLRRARPQACRLEHLLIGIAALLLGWYAFVAVSTTHEQAALARELEQLRFTTGSLPGEPARRALTARLAPQAVIGRIDVPRLKLSALAREGTDVQTLQMSVGHVPESAMPGDVGNAAFAGDRDTFFRKLEGVREGDEIIVTTGSGVFNYIVTTTHIVAATGTPVLAPTKGRTLTLVTCYPFDYIGVAPERFIVRAEAVAATR